MCNMTLFPPFFESEMFTQRRVPSGEKQGNILLTINVFPDTQKWLWFAASTEFGGYSLIRGVDHTVYVKHFKLKE